MIISRKRFEEEVYRRLDQERDRMNINRVINNMEDEFNRNIRILNDRISRLEEEIRGKKREKGECE